MSQAPRCPACDCELPADAPAGLCPQCLMLAGFNSGTAPDPGYAATSPHTPPGGFVPPTAQEIAPLFPQLEILQLLGQGGMGAVYKARQVGLDRLVAVKILPPEISRDPSFAERFTREARALARLSHPNIVAVYDFGQTRRQESGDRGQQIGGSLFYIVMEFVDGANLRQVIREKATTPPQALALVPQICEALQFAHDEGIVHRDIKPENILVDKRGRVKIADFGLAKMLGVDQTEGTLTGTHQVMGTIRYMAPEQLEGSHDVDHRADIYSLGVVFYELLTGELPIGRFAPPSKKVQIDVRLDEVVLRALEKEPEQRWQQASQVKTELTSIAGSSGRAMLDESQQVVARPRFSRRAIVAAVCAPLVFGAALPLMVAETVTTSGAVGNASPPAGVPIWIQIGAGLLTLLGVAAPFATTILGGMAVAEIRRSNGKLYGLPLAVADVLLFPLLVLDGLICAAVVVCLALVTGKEPSPSHVALLIGLPLAAWADYLIIRAVWRSVAGEATRKQETPAVAIESHVTPTYTRWVIAPMLVLTAIWIGASFAVSARSQGSAGGDYDPIRIMQVQLWGGVAVGLALPILLVLRWSRTLPPSVRAVFYTRNMISVAVAVLAFAALVAYFISPWNQPHVESRGITFRPQSGAFSELKIGVGMLSHSRTTGRYRRPDVCEFTLDVGGYATRGRYTVDDVGSLTWHVGGEERAFDRERFISWLRSVAMLPLDQPAVRQEAEELASLVETWNRDAPGDFEVLFAIAQAGLADFDRGPDLPSRSYVQGNPRLGFFYAFGAICLAFIAALAINIVVARRSATTA